jgi:hypothetical protein
VHSVTTAASVGAWYNQTPMSATPMNTGDDHSGAAFTSQT